jgi:hypothetical protein
MKSILDWSFNEVPLDSIWYGRFIDFEVKVIKIIDDIITIKFTSSEYRSYYTQANFLECFVRNKCDANWHKNKNQTVS